MRDVPAPLHGAVSFSDAWWEVHAESNDVSASANSSAAQMRRLLKRSAFGSITDVYLKHGDKANSETRSRTWHLSIVVRRSLCSHLHARLPNS